ncbi:DNA cytosine methyltransferase [Hydrogenophaga sp.]|uniref:DNA cytosine methyltransferase n=1 Tax=Hydrogenophaga sp. TaxID=1904254 RepID=UPI003D13286D
MQDNRTFYEFFAGGGMARAGLGDGWQCLLANDISPMKAAAYAENYGTDHLHVGDIYDLKAAKLPGRADLAWGSFPCQDLSLAGAGAGLQGDRSGCFWGFWKLIQGLNKLGRKPPLVVLENVYGALTSHEGADFEAIVNAILREGYVVGAMVVDAVHFVPQSRPRLFIIGVSKEYRLPDGVAHKGPAPAWHPDALIRAFNRLPARAKKSWVWFNPPGPEKLLKTMDDVIEREPQGVKWHTRTETKRLLEMMVPLHRAKVLKAQSEGRLTVGTIYRRTRLGVQRAEVRFDGVSGCLRTPSGGSSRQTIIVVEGARIRTRLLSPREAARLMGLDDSYKLPARYNDAYHVAGDGVVVPVVAHLARHLLEPLMMANARQAQRRAA